jgi:hypothetical membrane protein
MVRKALLICGVFAPLIWMAADVAASMQYPGYSYTDQAISELSAIGAPTVGVLSVTGSIYLILAVLFAVGVVLAAGDKRSLRYTGFVLLALGAVGVAGAFFPMNMRQAEKGFTDTMHVILSGVATVLLILLAIGFGATAFGKRWRIYSYVTIVVLIVFGAWAFIGAPDIEANLPTPWLGLRERINVYGFMVWMLALAVALLRRQTPARS